MGDLMKKLIVLSTMLTLQSMAAWKYEQKVDKMHKTTKYFASSDSKDKTTFRFPYNGGSIATMVITNTPGVDHGAGFIISRGQFSCGDDCHIDIKLDDEPVESVRAFSGDSPDYLGISDNDVTAKILKAKKITIEPVFFQEGSRQFTFKIDDLKIDKLKL